MPHYRGILLPNRNRFYRNCIFKMFVSKKNISLIGNLLLVLCALILLSQLWGISYTTGDDKSIAVARYEEGGVLAVAIHGATAQGRFYQLFTYSLVQLPNLFEPFLALNITRIISNLLPFLAFYFMTRQLFGDRVAKIASFVGLGIFETTGSFNPFHALPLWFNTNAFLLMLSIGLYHRRLQQERSLILPSALFFSSLLFYESFLLYLPVFGAIYWQVCCSQHLQPDIKNQIIRALRVNQSMLAVVIAYLVLYVAFRANFFKPEIVGGGLMFSLASVSEIVKTIYKFSLGSIAMKIRLPTMDEILSLAGLFSLILTLGLSLALVTTRKRVSSSFVRMPLGWLVLLYAAIAPNILYAFTERYREWALGDSCYIGSYYSVFAIALSIALVVTKEFPSFGSIRRNYGVYISIMVALFIASSLNFINTKNYFDYKRLDALHWPAMQAAIPALKQSNITRLCSETFVTHPSDAHYWTYYLKGTLNRDMQVRLLPNFPQHCDGFIEYDVKNNLGLIKISTNKDVIYSNF